MAPPLKVNVSAMIQIQMFLLFMTASFFVCHSR